MTPSWSFDLERVENVDDVVTAHHELASKVCGVAVNDLALPEKVGDLLIADDELVN